MGRIYKWKGRSFPSSTTICGQLDKSGPLTYWAAGCAGDYVIDKVEHTKTLTRSKVIAYAEESKKKFRSVLKKAGDLGSAVHKAIEFYLKNDKAEPKIDDEKVLAGFIAFLEWADQHHLEKPQAEVTVYGKNYAGTLDCLCILDGVPTILDIKTSKAPRNGKPYEEWRLQVASYRAAAIRMKLIEEGINVGSGILRPDKETGYPDYYDISDTHGEDFAIFQALAKVWWLRHPQYADDFEGAVSTGYGD